MNLESTLFYVTHHSESIIQWLFLTILVLAGFVIGRAILGKKPVAEVVAAPTAAPSAEIQQFLQRILDQTTKLEGISLEGLAPKAVAEVDAQVQTLKKDLAAREEELSKMKAEGNSKPSEDTQKLSGRIEELEAKLAEYEILEDDIADLSLYKEENTRLRGEIEKVRGSGGGLAPAPSQFVAPPSATASAPLEESLSEMEIDGPSDDIVAEFAQAVSQEVESADPAKVELSESGDPLADFEAAMNLEKKMMGGEPAPVAAPIPTVAAVATAVQVNKDDSGEGDDLFAEFAQSSDGESDQESLDTDKMMAEMAALVTTDPSSKSGLEEEIDTDKMASEATRLHKS